MAETVYERVKGILREYACIDEKSVRPDSHLQKDLLLNSLDVVNVIVEFEEAFDIEVDEADIHSFATVSDVAAYIEQKAGPAGRGARA